MLETGHGLTDFRSLPISPLSRMANVLARDCRLMCYHTVPLGVISTPTPVLAHLLS